MNNLIPGLEMYEYPKWGFREWLRYQLDHTDYATNKWARFSGHAFVLSNHMPENEEGFTRWADYFEDNSICTREEFGEMWTAYLIAKYRPEVR